VKKIILLLFLLPQVSFSGDFTLKKDSLYFLNSNLLFVPLQASVFEAKNGVTKFINKKNLMLDIGVTMDLVGIKSKQQTYTFGADFFTFSNLRNESNFKFPVDAIDYFFGINFNYKKKYSNTFDLLARFRISHISSHFEDGHIYENSDTIFTPVVFSKEFFDLAVMAEYNFTNKLSGKGLLGVNYIFHSIPEMADFSGQFGLELRYYFYKILSFYISNDASLGSVNSVSNLNESFETGITIGQKDSRAISFYFDYYDGQDYKGQYYGNYLNYTGLGFRIKF